jgi:transcriptional regulator with XRE-family HTH domain
MTFIEAMQSLKDRKSMSQVEIAKHLHVLPQEVSAWMVGSRVPSQRKRADVAALLGISVDKLARMIEHDTFLSARIDDLEKEVADLRLSIAAQGKALAEIRRVLRRRGG